MLISFSFAGRLQGAAWHREGDPPLDDLPPSLAATVATATVAAAAATTATSPILSGLGFIDSQGPSIDLFAVQGLNSGLGMAIVRHFHETESSRPAGKSVHYYSCGRDFTERSKRALELFIVSFERKVAHIYVHAALL
jgi:hypothetical protein